MRIHLKSFILVFFMLPAAANATLGTPLIDATLVHPMSGPAEVEVDIAVDGHGDYVIVWEVDGSDPEVRGQRFTSHGKPTGSQFLIDGPKAMYPEVAGNPSGDTVVVWQHGSPEAVYIYARQYAADGTAGPIIQVDPAATMFAGDPDVSMADDGSFVVVWADRALDSIRGRRFDPNGVPLGDVFQVSTASESVWLPSVALAPTGEFVVAWSQQYRIVARKYDSNGNPTTGEVFLDTGNGKEKRGEPRLAMLPNGGFAAVWADFYSYGTVVKGYYRIFDQQIVPLSAEMEFHPDHNLHNPDIAADRKGRFVITWVFPHDDVVAENCFRYFDSDGVALTGVTSLSGTVRPAYLSPIAVALDADGDMFATWSPTAQDLYMRLFQGDADVDLGVTVGGNPSSASPGENVTYTVTVNNATPAIAEVGAGSASGVVATFGAFVGDGTMVSVSSSDGTCTSGSTSARCELKTISAGDSAQMEVTIQAPESGFVGGNAKIYLHQADSNTENNEDSVLAEVVAGSGGTSSSGGGGGALDWLAAMGLGILLLRRKELMDKTEPQTV